MAFIYSWYLLDIISRSVSNEQLVPSSKLPPAILALSRPHLDSAFSSRFTFLLFIAHYYCRGHHWIVLDLILFLHYFIELVIYLYSNHLSFFLQLQVSDYQLLDFKEVPEFQEYLHLLRLYIFKDNKSYQLSNF